MGNGHDVVVLFNKLPGADVARVSEQERSGVACEPFSEPAKDVFYRDSHNLCGVGGGI